MVTNQQTDFVFFSQSMKTDYSDYYHEFIPKLNEYNIEYDFLPVNENVWCRDYMPIQVRKDKFVQFNYNPDYLQGYENLKPDTKTITDSLGFDIIRSEINIDGGNIIESEDKVILTDKIFQENPDFTPNELTKELSKLFETENIIIIPQLPYDDLGHSDGMVRFYNKNTVLTSDFSKTHSKSWLEKFQNTLERYNLESIKIPYTQPENRNSEGIYPATGCYINYLHIGDLIFLPTFDLPQDKINLHRFKKLYPDHTIQPIYCQDIAIGGGVLNCISWNIKK